MRECPGIGTGEFDRCLPPNEYVKHCPGCEENERLRALVVQQREALKEAIDHVDTKYGPPGTNNPGCSSPQGDRLTPEEQNILSRVRMQMWWALNNPEVRGDWSGGVLKEWRDLIVGVDRLIAPRPGGSEGTRETEGGDPR